MEPLEERTLLSASYTVNRNNYLNVIEVPIFNQSLGTLLGARLVASLSGSVNDPGHSHYLASTATASGSTDYSGASGYAVGGSYSYNGLTLNSFSKALNDSGHSHYVFQGSSYTTGSGGGVSLTSGTIYDNTYTGSGMTPFLSASEFYLNAYVGVSEGSHYHYYYYGGGYTYSSTRNLSIPSAYWSTATTFTYDQPPTDIGLSNASVAENQSSGTTVAAFSSVDPDAGDTFTYSLVSGTGSTNNTSFSISGNTLLTAASFDYEAQSNYSIRVRSTDQNGSYFEKVLTISITDVNDTPTNIGLSNASVAENQPVGTAVGNLATTDPDAGSTFTYSLVTGTGDTGNASFTIVGNQLQTAAAFDCETQNTYSIRVRSTDQGGLFYEKVFSINMTNISEFPPTDIGLSSATLIENMPVGFTLATLSTADLDAGESFTYSLVSGAGSADNASFAIIGDQLQTAASFDYETQNSFSIRLRSTDSGGLWLEKPFTITVTNLAEPPVAVHDEFDVGYATTLNLTAPGVLANDIRREGTALTATLATAPAHGNLTLNTNGAFQYTPDPGFRGTDEFTYTLSDGLQSAYTAGIVRLHVGRPVLVKDINALTAASTPSNLLQVGNLVFFTATDPDYGNELWRSDGTPEGTMLVKDIYAGANSSSPANLANVNGTLFFTAGDAANGVELWKSDGTAAGTVLVKDIYAGASNSSPANLTNVGGTLFFAATDATNGQELWKSDGTAAGTVLVKDIYAGATNSSLVNLTNVNGILFFTATDGTNGIELWKSDGAAAGTVLVKDIYSGATSSSPAGLTNVNGTLFFSANNGTNGIELWKTDGTTAGTVLVKDIYGGATSSSPANLANVSGTLFFAATDAANGSELWKSDGTAAGTVLVKDIYSGASSASPGQLTNLNGILYFSASDGTNGTELWKSDGTTAGTVLVKDIYSGAGGSSPASLTNVNGTLFFAATDAANGQELWKSDGTAAGTVLVKDIFAGSTSSSLGVLTSLNGRLLFRANDFIHSSELWISDGASSGTQMLKDLNAGTSSASPGASISINGTLYFAASDGTNGTELWKSDGTAAGTVLVKDISAGISSSSPSLLTNVGGTLFFRATDAINGTELWKSDGTTAGTVLVRDIYSGTTSSTPASLTNVGGTLFFTATDATGAELWKSDGTTAGTVLVKDIYGGATGSSPGNLTNVNGTLFFTATDATNGLELWKSDGTAAGTVLVKDIYAGSSGSSPVSLTNFNGALYFQATDSVNGNEFWKSDGTAAGTVLVKDIYAGATGSSAALFTNVNGTLFFSASDATNGVELWKSDGTAAGTVLVKDIYPGAFNSNVSLLTNVAGTLFFRATDATNGTELWKSDGTTAGTVLVKDIYAGTANSTPANLTTLGGVLFFTAADATNSTELWRSDGTAAGTMLAADIAPGTRAASPANLTASGGSLFFTANDSWTNFELWMLSNSGPTDIGLSNATLSENAPNGMTVGNLTATDSDVDDSIIYTLRNSAGGRFKIVGSQLQVDNGALLDYESNASHSITVRATDLAGLYFDKTLTIAVLDAPITPALGDRVWSDLNANGIQDAGEPGIAGVLVELMLSTDATAGNADDISLGQVATDATGHYAFANLETLSNLYLVFHLPVGYTFTTQDAGADDVLDSDVAPTAATAGQTAIFLATGVSDASRDAGLLGAAPAFGFALGAGAANSDIGRAIAVDAAGNSYVAGYYQGSVDFDPSPAVVALTSVSTTNSDIFVAKYTAAGALVWARSMGGTSADQALGIALASDGSIYTTGYFIGTADFDPGDGAATLTSAGSNDVFISKLDSAGNFLWAKALGGTSADIAYSIAIAADGSVYTTGYFTSTADFDPSAVGTSNLTSAGSNDIFVSKLDSAGNYLWAKAIGGTAVDLPSSIAIAADGSVFTTGYFNGTADFDPSAGGTSNLTSAGGTDAFVTKLDSAGNYLWAKALGGTGADAGNGIAVASDGAVYTAGYFGGTADFDPSAGGTANLTSAGGSDVFVSKLDSAGNHLWAKALGGTSSDIAYAIAVTSNGSVYTTGYFNGTADFDPGSGVASRTSAGGQDVFLSKLDAAGNFAWARAFGGATAEGAYSIVLGADGSAYSTGYFTGTADFDPGSGAFNLANAGSNDLFVARHLAPQAPTGVAISSSSVAENSPADTAVGNLSTTDPETGDTFSYALPDSAGGRFKIVGSQLRVNTAALLDYEAATSHSVTVRSTDGSGLYFDQLITVTLTDVNEAPTGLALANAVVAENQTAGTLVGNLSATDLDANQTLTFSLAAGVGADDNTAFAVSGAQLTTAAIFDYETKSTYHVRLRVTDQDGLWYEDTFTIGVSDVNEAPVEITLSNASVAENQAAGTLVGLLVSVDQDSTPPFAYLLVSGAGSADNAAFTIDGSANLRTASTFDHEVQSNYNIRVRSTDQSGLWFENQFTINVTNVNETPSDIALSSSAVAENQSSGTAVGTFSATDPDAGNTFTYSLVTGDGSADNASFAIVGNQLQTAASFDCETQNAYSIRVRTTDQGGLWFEKAFTISVGNVNEAPTGISLSVGSVAENRPAGTVVGNLTAVDFDANQTLAFSLVSGTGSSDNNSFSIDGNGNLLTAATFDYETQSSYAIRVRATDQGGLWFEKAFTISVTDLEEIPPTVTGTTPSFATNGTLAAGTTSLQVNFSEAILGGATAANYQLQSLGADALLGTADDTIVSLTAGYSGTTATLTFAALPEGVYRLTVKQAITDIVGNALDGDANGSAGGNWLRDFLVDPTPRATIAAPHMTLDVETMGFGAGALLQGPSNAFDGLGRLSVDGTSFSAQNLVTAADVSSLTAIPSVAIPANSTYVDVPGLTFSVTSTGWNVRLSSTLRFGASQAGQLYVKARFLVDGTPWPERAIAYEPLNGNFVLRDVTLEQVQQMSAGVHQVRVQIANYGSPVSLYNSTIYGQDLAAVALKSLTPSGSTANSYWSYWAPGVQYATNYTGTVLSGNFIFNDYNLTRLASTVRLLPASGTGLVAAYARFVVDGNPLSWRYVAYEPNRLNMVLSNVEEFVVMAPGTHSVALQIYNVGDPILLSGAPEMSQDMFVTEVTSIAGFGPTMDVNAIAAAPNGSITSGMGFVDVPGLQTDVYADGSDAMRLAATLGINPASGLTIAEARFVIDGAAQPSRNIVYETLTGAALKIGNLEQFVTLSPGSHQIKVQIASGANPFNVVPSPEAAQMLSVMEVKPAPSATLDDSQKTVITPTQTLSQLAVHREVTVPGTGNEDFARTVDVFTNPTGSPITTTVRIVGNLGSDAATTVFGTFSGDTTIETSDQWVGTDDADGSGTPAIIHYIHGPRGLQPTAVSVTGDNIEWTYSLTVPAGQTVRLEQYTIVNTTRAGASAAAAALVSSTGFGGQAAAFLTQAELDSLANFQFYHAPTDMGLSPASVSENQPAGSTAGSLSTTDADAGDTFTYTLVSGTGGTDNSSFTVAGNQLQINAAFNYESKSSYSVRVRTTDQDGFWFEKAFTISVINVNESPTDILLPLSSVLEQQPVGTPVWTFASVDPDLVSTFTYSLVAGPGSADNSSFTIDAMGNLLTASVFDFAAKSSYSIRVRSTDQGGLIAEKSFTITVGQLTNLRVDLVSSALPSSTANAGSYAPSFSADGRYVVFSSNASNLVSSDTNGYQDIFVKDLLTGVIIRASTSSGGAQGDSQSDTPILSGDGRYVAFRSYATNLVAGDTNGSTDVFVKDLLTGITTRVSTDSAGTQGNSYSETPSVSSDGRYVAFRSSASNLVAGDTNGAYDIFVKDLLTGVTTRASTDSAGSQGNNLSDTPSLSGDGRYVAFGSYASNLISGDTNGTYDIFVKDLLTGATTRVSTDSAGAQGNSYSFTPALSGNGRYVAFQGYASNLVSGDTNGYADVFVKDLLTGVTTRVSTDSAGAQGNSSSFNPSLSGDGRYVAFWSYASNLVSGDTNGYQDVFIKDLLTGVTARVSTDSAGAQGNGDSSTASLSGNGRCVAFQSNASNLIAGDANGSSDIFVKDVTTAATSSASSTPPLTGGSASSYTPSVSSDGRYVAFFSSASNLVSGDTNGVYDIFLKDLLTGATTRVSTDSAGTQGNSTSYSPSISGDGRYVTFRSDATNLVAGDTNGYADVFVKDLLTGGVTRVSTDSAGTQGNNSSDTPRISSNGRFVAFRSYASNLVAGDTNGVADILVKDLLTGVTIRVSTDSAGVLGNDESINPSISADGRYVVFMSGASNLVSGDTNGSYDIFVKDLLTGVTARINTNTAGAVANNSSSSPSISGDGRYVTFQSYASNLVSGDTNGTSDIFVKDLLTGVTTRVSTDTAGNQGNNDSQSPVLSSDGGYVAFYSSANNLVTGDTGWIYDIFVKDLLTGVTTRLSTDSAGGQASSGSYTPSISGDGRYVAFQSTATNLHPWDTSSTADIFRVSNPTPPTDIALTGASIAENGSGGALIGLLASTAPFTSTAFTYSLVSGAGSSGNGAFTISGNQLLTAAAFDYETQSSYSIRVRTTDQRGLWFEKAFTISVTNVNEQPTDISLAPATVHGQAANGTSVGTLATSDPDSGDTFNYTLLDDAGGRFALSGGQIVVANGALLDYAAATSHTISVRSTDAGGLNFTKNVTIGVLAPATRTWDGGGTTNNWSDAANWVGDVAPATGDDLSFPSGAARLTNVNDLSSAAFRNLAFSGGGYIISGNPIALQTGIQATNASSSNRLSLAITLLSPQAFSSATGAWGGTHLFGAVNLNGNMLTVDASDGLYSFYGAISGSGGLVKTGNGQMYLDSSSPNTYLGTTTVNGGTLYLQLGGDGVLAVPGDLIIGDGVGGAGADQVIVRASNRIADTATVTINSSGSLELWSATAQDTPISDTIGSVTLNGGQVSSTGTLTVLGDITTQASTQTAYVSGNLSLGGQTRTITVANGSAANDLIISAVVSNGGIVKAGAGTLALSGPNTYSGVTTLTAGILAISHASALGTAVGGTSVAAGAALQMSNNIAVAAEPLVINGSGVGGTGALYSLSGYNSWSGPITLGFDATIAHAAEWFTVNGSIDTAGHELTYDTRSSNQVASLNGIISGAGGLRVKGTGEVELYAANTYSGTTTIQEGALSLQPGASTLGDTTGGTIVMSGASLFLNKSTGENLTVAGNGKMFGALAPSNGAVLSGTVTLAGNTRVYTSGWGDTVFAGAISDLGLGYGLDFQANTSTQRTVLSGANTYTGETTVNSGVLLVNDSLAAGSAVTVNNSGTLGGTGTVAGPITVNFGGKLAPGTSPGILHTGSLALQSGAAFTAEINGITPGSQYDRLDVAGTVNLDGASLNVSLGFTPGASDVFVLIANDGSDPVVGTFTQGNTITLGGTLYAIGYAGGDGNDVTLSLANAAPTNITLANASVAENQPAGTAVGTLSTSDPNAGDTFTYALVSGAGSTDNTSFTIDGNQLKTAAVFDYETRSSYSIRVRTTDQGGLWFEKAFTISVTNVNETPTVATPASAVPNPVTGSSTQLSVLGADDAGAANLSYAWTTTGAPPAAVSFSANGSNAAKNTIATFTKAGTYNFLVTIADMGGLTTTSNVSVTVNQTLTGLVVSPTTRSLKGGGTQQFSATANDQFGDPLASSPTFDWTASSGLISTTGFYMAPNANANATVTATAGGFQATAAVTVDATSPVVTVSSRTTSDATPALSGTVDDSSAVVAVTVNGQSYIAANNGNGTWSLADNAITTFLADGCYDVAVYATDAVGNMGVDGTSGELLIDTTRPTSRVNTLASRQNGLVFFVTATTSDPLPAANVPVSGVVGYEVYVAVDGGAWSLWQTIPIVGPYQPFTAASNHSYSFRSVAGDWAGNAESKAVVAEASTYVPDLTPPDTAVTSVAHSTAAFTVNFQGTDAGGSGLAAFRVLVQLDGGPVQTIATVNAGTPSGSLYSGSVAYQALADGNSHSYRFFAQGLDGNGNLELAPAAPADAQFSATFAQPATLTATNFNVQQGAAQRSFVRYLDTTFNDTANLANIANLANGRMQLLRFGLDGSGAGVAVSLQDKVRVVDHVIQVDFGATGMGGSPLTNAADGYYALAFDLDGNGSFETVKHFYRLLGDSNGDRIVDSVDVAAITAAIGKSGTNLNTDINGDGVVSSTDRTLASRAVGRKISANLSLDN